MFSMRTIGPWYHCVWPSVMFVVTWACYLLIVPSCRANSSYYLKRLIFKHMVKVIHIITEHPSQQVIIRHVPWHLDNLDLNISSNYIWYVWKLGISFGPGKLELFQRMTNDRLQIRTTEIAIDHPVCMLSACINSARN